MEKELDTEMDGKLFKFGITFDNDWFVVVVDDDGFDAA